ncbi:MAG: hypothetical protein ACLP9L_05770 [Thermoguttaceae bacterium]
MAIPLWWVTQWDLMVGTDLHDEYTMTTPPVKVPMTPHIVGAFMQWFTNSDGFPKTVLVEGRKPCKHMHDIKYLIPHVPIPLPACLLWPVHTAVSQSKVLLGAFTVICEGEPVGLYPCQLNCGKPCNLPTGMNFPTRLPTVYCGFGVLDLLFSLLVGAFDSFLSWVIGEIIEIPVEGIVLQKLLEGVAKKVAKWIIKGKPNEIAKKFGVSIDLPSYRAALGNFMSDVVAGWNPHATPERVARAADLAVVLHADMIFDGIMDPEQGALSSMGEVLAEHVGEQDADRIIAETRKEISRDEWREMFDKGFGEGIREGFSQALWDYCEEVGAAGPGGPPAA